MISHDFPIGKSSLQFPNKIKSSHQTTVAAPQLARRADSVCAPQIAFVCTAWALKRNCSYQCYENMPFFVPKAP